MNTGKTKINYHILISAVFSTLCLILFLSGCGKAEPAVSQKSSHPRINIDEKLTKGTVSLSAAQLASYGEIVDCLFSDTSGPIT